MRARSKVAWHFLREKPPQAGDIEVGVPVVVRVARLICGEGELAQ